MPSRNVIKQDIPESYYHIYARGIGKQAVFLDAQDFNFFISLFGRYLSNKQQSSAFGPYPHFKNLLQLLCYCLLNNHFHLLVYQAEKGSMSKLMQSLMTSYSRYFNKKYHRSGPVFESRYKASRITQDTYLAHISRYIHLNPRYWQRYPYASTRFYLGSTVPEWLDNSRIFGLFEDARDYLRFLKDYEEQMAMLDEIKHELAG